MSRVPEMKAVRATVTGRVQGVGFRYATAEEARRRGLAGWVRNLADGRVEVMAQGSVPVVDSLVAWLTDGPRLASVVNVEVVSVEPETDLAGFSVRF